ncbi:hypothetical protein BTVI_19389 [Pitangus sulphuratus]|nr:hypothetical protein BTVI_19389 [Pitangus sulphuratus]
MVTPSLNSILTPGQVEFRQMPLVSRSAQEPILPPSTSTTTDQGVKIQCYPSTRPEDSQNPRIPEAGEDLHDQELSGFEHADFPSLA